MATALPVATDLTGAGVTEATFKTKLTAIRAALAEMGDPLARFGLVMNLALALSVSGNALTIALKTRALADADADNPVSVPFRNATIATGDFSVINVTAASSLVVPDTALLGTTNSVAFRLWIVGFNDAGTFRLGVINCLSGMNIYPLKDDALASSTAVGTGSDSAQVIYTGSAVTTKALRVLGFADWSAGLATAGTWSSGPTKVQLFGPGVPLPGQVVQSVRTDTGAVATGTTTLPVDDTIPQNTEGDQYMTQAITPTSTANLLHVIAEAMVSSDQASSHLQGALFQDSTAGALKANDMFQAGAQGMVKIRLDHRMLAATVSATTFKTRVGGNNAGTTTFNGRGGARVYGGVMNSFMQVDEIVG